MLEADGSRSARRTATRTGGRTPPTHSPEHRWYKGPVDGTAVLGTPTPSPGTAAGRDGHAPRRLDDINEAFRAMKAGEVARTVLTFD